MRGVQGTGGGASAIVINADGRSGHVAFALEVLVDLVGKFFVVKVVSIEVDGVVRAGISAQSKHVLYTATHAGVGVVTREEDRSGETVELGPLPRASRVLMLMSPIDIVSARGSVAKGRRRSAIESYSGSRSA